MSVSPYTIHIHKMQIGYLKTTIIVMVTAMINANANVSAKVIKIQ